MGDNLKRAFNEEQKNQILDYFYKGLSSRKICKKLGWDITRKSTVNDFLKPFRDIFNDCDKWESGELGADEDYAVSKGMPDKLKDVLSNQRKSLNGVSTNKPKLLFFDLESSLMEGYFFRIWQENIPMRRVKKQSHLLTASWAFNDEEVQGVRLSVEDVKTGNDFDVVVKMIEAINKCDVLVTFNGKRFDMKLLNTRALYWGLPPITPKKHVDLMEQAKRKFKFPSNSLQNISMYLGESGKLETSGSNLWERCAETDNYDECEKALSEMFQYNKIDIDATRDLYKRFQGWMTNTPNLGTITNDKSDAKTLRCVHCGSDNVFPIDQKTYTTVSSFDLYRCSNIECRGVSRVNGKGAMLVGVV